jgi:large subunit ribosomal protein L24
MNTVRIRKNDKVLVIAGRDKGKIAKVLSIDTKKRTALVENINMVKRHVKPNPYKNQQGGIVDKEAPINLSNVMLVCDSCAKPTRVGYKLNDKGRKIRFCKKCNAEIQ